MLEDERLELGQIRLAKTLEAEGTPDLVAVLDNRLAVGAIGLDFCTGDVELEANIENDVINDFEGLLCREPIEETDMGELISEAQTILIAPTLPNQPQVGYGNDSR